MIDEATGDRCTSVSGAPTRPSTSIRQTDTYGNPLMDALEPGNNDAAQALGGSVVLSNPIFIDVQ